MKKQSTNGHNCQDGRRSRMHKFVHIAGATVALGLTAVAITKELKKPESEREWHGFIGIVPYDFRIPTIEMVKERVWDPAGPVLTPHILGVGWTPNVGRVIKDVKDLAENES